MAPKTEEIARSAKSGVGPESLIHIGDRKDTPVSVRLIDYDLAEVNEKQLVGISDCSAYSKTDTVSWFDIDGIHDPALTEAIGKRVRHSHARAGRYHE